MHYGLLPYQTLISRIRRDTRLSDANMLADDMREWTAEACRALAAPRAYSTRTVALHYANHRCQLPSDWAGYACSCTEFERHYDQLLFKQAAGVATVTYYVLPTDAEGMPMLIDEPNAQEYYFWAVAEKLARLGDIPASFNPEDCNRKKLDYKLAAETALRIPTRPGASRLRRHW